MYVTRRRHKAIVVYMYPLGGATRQVVHMYITRWRKKARVVQMHITGWSHKARDAHMYITRWSHKARVVH